jgi:alkylhydroperoxidase/carboxymuconolactone decarboxylase family protein YurZ
MYMRGILDERTRILCIIGELFVAGDVDQAQNHMRGVLHHGATPREVLEVILQSTIYVGMPRFIRFIAALERVLETEGRLDELRAPPAPGTPGTAA